MWFLSFSLSPRSSLRAPQRSFPLVLSLWALYFAPRLRPLVGASLTASVARARRYCQGPTSRGAISDGHQKEKGCEEDEARGQEGRTPPRKEGRIQAEAECRIHEADAAVRAAGRRCRIATHAAHRGDEEAVGVHQAEGTARLEGAAHDQRRRPARGGLRWEDPRVDVRHDETRQPASEGRVVLSGSERRRYPLHRRP